MERWRNPLEPLASARARAARTVTSRLAQQVPLGSGRLAVHWFSSPFLASRWWRDGPLATCVQSGGRAQWMSDGPFSRQVRRPRGRTRRHGAHARAFGVGRLATGACWGQPARAGSRRPMPRPPRCRPSRGGSLSQSRCRLTAVQCAVGTPRHSLDFGNPAGAVTLCPVPPDLPSLPDPDPKQGLRSRVLTPVPGHFPSRKKKVKARAIGRFAELAAPTFLMGQHFFEKCNAIDVDVDHELSRSIVVTKLTKTEDGKCPAGST